MYNDKMLTLVLPGGSAKNKEWAQKTAQGLDLGHIVRPVLWEHWDNPDMPFDPKDKAGELLEVAMDDSLNIVAKSIGTLVAVYILQDNPDRIKKLILCGIPLHDLSESDLKNYEVLKNFPTEKIVCFQNADDPHASYIEVEKFLKEINPKIKIISKSRNDHDYPFYSEFQGFLNG